MLRKFVTVRRELNGLARAEDKDKMALDSEDETVTAREELRIGSTILERRSRRKMLRQLDRKSGDSELRMADKVIRVDFAGTTRLS